MSRQYKTDYKLVKWDSPERFVEILQELSDQGYRTDLSRVYKDDAEGGWTIFSKTYEIRPSIMDADIPLREIWSILNSTEVVKAEMDHADENQKGYGGPTTDIISNRVKAWYYRVYPEPKVNNED